MSAGIATLELLDKDFYQRLGQKTHFLCQSVRHHVPEALPLSYNYYPGMFSLYPLSQPPRNFEEVKQQDLGQFASFFQKLLSNGLYWPPSVYESAFLSDSHTFEQLEKAASILAKAIEETAG